MLIRSAILMLCVWTATPLRAEVWAFKAPLAEVVAAFNAVNPQEQVTINPEARDKTVMGRLDLHNVQGLVRWLQLTLGCRVSLKERRGVKTYVLSGCLPSSIDPKRTPDGRTAGSTDRCASDISSSRVSRVWQRRCINEFAG